MKKCTKCGLEKLESEFYKNKDSKDGLYYFCKECHDKYTKEYQKTDKHKEYQKEYQQKDEYKEYQNEYQKEYQKKRKSIDPKYKLDCNMGSIISMVLKGKKAGRKWESLVGYTIEDLMNHLESKFEPWMNWDNQGIGIGKWNLDHIKPKSLFKYESAEDEEFKKCWALSNLQPLDAIKNIKKGNNY